MLSEYRAMLLRKLLEPHDPVLCIMGALGSGKTTTLTYLLGIIKRMGFSCCGCGALCAKRRLLATIDFRQLGHGRFSHGQPDSPHAEATARKLIREICRELP